MSPVSALAWLLAAALPAAPLAAPMAVSPAAGAGIPAFSRAYGTSCVTCHVTPGKLNGQGEAFRLNGYRFPDDEDRLQGDNPVALGAEPWKELWPAAIWPGQVPGALPLEEQGDKPPRQVVGDFTQVGMVVRSGRQLDGQLRTASDNS